jgi:hypothetical protein
LKYLNSRYTLAALLSLVIGLGAFSGEASAQSTSSIRVPGDITLFGDPDCDHWLPLEFRVKEVWLNAILSPINMTYMHRERPATNRFTALRSLAPAVEFVDDYCQAKPKAKAMSGAVRYFEVLTGAGLGTDSTAQKTPP